MFFEITVPTKHKLINCSVFFFKTIKNLLHHDGLLIIGGRSGQTNCEPIKATSGLLSRERRAKPHNQV